MMIVPNTTDLDRAIAQEFFGWKWVAFWGIPIKGTKNYPKKCMVRQFFPPESLENEDWILHFEKNQARKSDGDEPLSYPYCSSCGPAEVPRFSKYYGSFFPVQIKLEDMGLWEEYSKRMQPQLCNAPNGDSPLGDFEFGCIVALDLVNSKYHDHEATPNS